MKRITGANAATGQWRTRTPALLLQHWGHGNISDVAVGTLLGMAVVLMIVGILPKIFQFSSGAGEQVTELFRSK